MVLSLKTNISGLNSTRHLNRVDTGVSSSLERLSSGLRINRAADDSSGLVIADSLRSQANGLGQAIRNATDAISIVQVADAALEESIEILNTIKIKSIQAAQDGQTTHSREAIQSDIQKLLQELDLIATTTSFNGQKLLSGSFTAKSFQIGAYSRETINLSIDSSTSSKIGHLTTGRVVLDESKEGLAYLGIKGGGNLGYTEIPPMELAYDNSYEHGLGALADQINQTSDKTGVRAAARVTSQTDTRIQAGVTDGSFKINSVPLGSISVMSNDADGSLVKAINEKTVQHGVLAAVNPDGRLILTSTDGRGIKVDPPPGQGSGLDKILGGKDLTTFGALHIQGQGAGVVDIKNLGGGEPVALADNSLNINAPATTHQDSVLSAGSIFTKDSLLAFPWVLEQNISGDRFQKDVSIEEVTLMPKGSSLGAGSIVLTPSDLPDTITVNSRGKTEALSYIKKGSVLKTDSILGTGTQLPAGNIVSAGTLFKGDALISSTIDTTASSQIKADSILETNTVIASGSLLKGRAVVDTTGPLTGSATIRSSSILLNGSTIASGTTLGAPAQIAAIAATTGTYTLSAGSFLEATTVFSSGTTLGGNAEVRQIANTASTYNLTINSILQATSVIASGTTLAGIAFISPTGPIGSDYQLSGGSSLPVGSVLGSGTTIIDAASVTVTGPTTGIYKIAANSTLRAGSVLGSGTTLTNTAEISGTGLTTGSYIVAASSTLEAGTVFGNGTTVNGSATINSLGGAGTIDLAVGSELAAGTFIQAGDNIDIQPVGTLNGPLSTVGVQTVRTAHSMVLSSGVLAGGSVLANGSQAGAIGFTLQDSMDPASDTTMTAGSNLAAGSTLLATSVIGAQGAALANHMINLGNDMDLAIGSSIANGSSLAATSVIGADGATLAGILNTPGGLTLTANSALGNGSRLAQGSIIGAEGVTLNSSMTLTGAMDLFAESTIALGSRLNQGSVIGANGAQLDVEMTTGALMTLEIGSAIAANTILNTNSIIGADGARLAADMNVGNDMTLTLGSTIINSSTLAVDSVLTSDKMSLVAAMTLAEDMTLTDGSKMGSGSAIEYGSYIWADATLISSMTLRDPMKLASDMRLASDLILGMGSKFGDNSILQKDSSVYLALELMSDMNMAESVSLDPGSQISAGKDSLILSGTRVGGDALLGDTLVVKKEFHLSRGSVLGQESVLRNGSTIGGRVETAFTETVSDLGMSVGEGTKLLKGSMLAEGTFLTSDILGLDGKRYARGIFLDKNLLIDDNDINESMTLGPGSVIATGSLLEMNSEDKFVAARAENIRLATLSNIQVLTQEGAQQAIGLADASITDLDRIRSDLGSVQNQLTSTIAGISAAKINIFSSESTIRDVDFSEEVMNLKKLQILSEAGKFALSSSSDRSSNLISLLTQIDQK